MGRCAGSERCRVCVCMCRVVLVCVVPCIPCCVLSVIVRFHVLSCGVRDLSPVSYSVRVRGVLLVLSCAVSRRDRVSCSVRHGCYVCARVLSPLPTYGSVGVPARTIACIHQQLCSTEQRVMMPMCRVCPPVCVFTLAPRSCSSCLGAGRCAVRGCLYWRKNLFYSEVRRCVRKRTLSLLQYDNIAPL